MSFWKKNPLGRVIRLLAYLSFDAGTQAVTLYRVGHWIHRLGIPLIPFFVERLNLFLTGAYIASTAQIGNHFDLKHAVGVVIGPTSVIGDNVTMLHAVTLGSIDFNQPGKRHPTIESGVLIGAGAVILGDITIGQQAKVGAGAIITDNVPPYTVIIGPKAVVVKVLAPFENFDVEGND